MHILSLLENLAQSTAQHSHLNKILQDQSIDVVMAFSRNDSAHLKKILGNTENLADRDVVVCLPDII